MLAYRHDQRTAATDTHGTLGIATGAVLYRGDWYHRRGFASDLCTAEWSKLAPERQAEYVKVQSLEDLGEQVRPPLAANEPLRLRLMLTTCRPATQTALYQQIDFHVPAPSPLGKALDSKTRQIISAHQASENHASAQLHRRWQQLKSAMQTWPHAQQGLFVSAVCAHRSLATLNGTAVQLGVIAAVGFLVAPRAWRGRMSNTLEAQLLAEEEGARTEKAAAKRRPAVSAQQGSAAKDRKVQRNRSRKERRRLVGGLESKDPHIELDDDSGSTQSSQSDSGASSAIQVLEESNYWTPAASSKQAKKSLGHKTSAQQSRQGVTKAHGVRTTSQTAAKATSERPRDQDRPRSSEEKQLGRKAEKQLGNGVRRSAAQPAQAATCTVPSLTKRSGQPSSGRSPRNGQPSMRSETAKPAAPVVNAWKNPILARSPATAEVCTTVAFCYSTPTPTC